jgi:hypothetical protein
MILGYTGSRKGMTGEQAAEITRFIITEDITEAHHGDCVGGDEQFHAICVRLDVPVVIHPPENDRYRAFCKGAIRIEDPLPFLDRNKVIVNVVELLLAAPKEDEEPPPMRGQGTWSTVRYARKTNQAFRIIWP